MIEEIRVYAEREPQNDGICLYIMRRDWDGKQTILRCRGGNIWNGEWDEVPDLGAVAPREPLSPTLWVTRDVAQSMVTALANIGVKPDQEARNEGELEATKRHLADMQRIVDKLLVNPPLAELAERIR